MRGSRRLWTGVESCEDWRPTRSYGGLQIMASATISDTTRDFQDISEVISTRLWMLSVLIEL